MGKYVIVALLENAEVGDRFYASDWLLHCTVTPNFEIELDIESVVVLVSEVVRPFRSMRIRALEDAWFGPQKDILVTLLEKKPELMRLHDELLASLGHIGATFPDMQYILDYRPHVTVQRHDRIRADSAVEISALAIVDREPEGDRTQRRVVARIALP